MDDFGTQASTRRAIDTMYSELSNCRRRLEAIESYPPDDPQRQHIPGLQEAIDTLMKRIPIAEARLRDMEEQPIHQALDYRTLLAIEREEQRESGNYRTPEQIREASEAERDEMNMRLHREAEQRVRESRLSWKMWNSTPLLKIREVLKREAGYMFPDPPSPPES